MAKTNQLCTNKVRNIKETKKIVGSKAKSMRTRAVVGNYRESGAMQFKKFDFFFISPKDPFGKLFLKTVTMFKSSSEAPFLRKIGKFKIGLNLEIMQN